MYDVANRDHTSLTCFNTDPEIEVKGKDEIIAHRCAKLLRRRVSVRYCNPYKMVDGVPEWGDTRWWLLKYNHDYDCDSHYLQPIVPVEFCPFCGKELIQYSN